MRALRWVGRSVRGFCHGIRDSVRWVFRSVLGVVVRLLSMFEEKSDGERRFSMLRCTVAAFAGALTYRMAVTLSEPGWPLAFMWFSTLFAIPFSKAMEEVKGSKLLDFFTGMGGSLSHGKAVASVATAVAEVTSTEPEGQ